MEMSLAALLPSILLLLFLFGASAFFSLSESALTASSRAKMHTLAEDGDWRAIIVNRILANKEKFIGAILLGNTAATTLAAAFSSSVLVNLFGEYGVYYATIGVTAILLIFSEVLPKTYALYHADKVARFVAPPMNLLMYVSTPVTGLVGWVVRMIMLGFGIEIDKKTRASDMDELRGAIELHDGPGAETKERRDMLRSILDLADVTVEEIMIHRRSIDMVNYDQGAEKAINEIMGYNHTRVPLWSNSPENIVGIVHVKQLLFALHEKQGKSEQIKLENIMLRPWFIPNTTKLLDQLQAFRERREHFAVVVDEYGTLMGIVTLEDILEEIVGEIDDEQDLVVPGVRKMPDGSYLVNGDLSIRDLNRELGWDLPDDDDYTTAAGLVIYESRRIPDPGMSFVFHGFQFDIMKRQRNQITVLRITPMVEEGTV